MGTFKLGVLFEENQARLGLEIVSGTRKILFVEGAFSLKPKDGILIIVGGDIPMAAIATAGKVGLLPMTANEARHIEAVVPIQNHNGNAGIEAKTFTEIHIGDVETLPMCREEIVNEKYANGNLKSE